MVITEGKGVGRVRREHRAGKWDEVRQLGAANTQHNMQTMY